MTESNDRSPVSGVSKPRRFILPPVWMLLALALGLFLHGAMPLWRIPLPGLDIAGTVIAVLGLVLIGASMLAFSRAGTGIVPFHDATALVAQGFYRFSRNPMYLGMVGILLGVALKAGSLGALLPLPAFVWVIRERFVLPEERFLEEAFGDTYLAYTSRVRRWL